jgi:lambda family phage minor tail protein L
MTLQVFADVQKLEPGDDVYLFELDLTVQSGINQRFHGYTQVGAILWQGNTYQPWPVQIAGIERTGAQQPTPTFSVGNVDGSISLLCSEYADCLDGIIRVHHTFGKYLDGQPGANPAEEFPVDIWYVNRKSQEDKNIVVFELAGAIDVDGAVFPGRQIVANCCTYIARGGYRGKYCGYTGPAVADLNDVSTTNPAIDDCSGTVAGCKFRYGNDPLGLMYGGIPGAGLVR